MNNGQTPIALQQLNLQRLNAPTSHQYGGLGKIALAAASAIGQRKQNQQREDQKTAEAALLQSILTNGNTPEGSFDASSLTPDMFKAALTSQNPLVQQALLTQFNKAKKASLLSAEQAQGLGFAEGSVVQQSPDGSFSVVQQPPKDTSLQESLAALTIAEKERENFERQNKAEAEQKATEIAGQGRLADAVTGLEGVDSLLQDDLYKSLFGAYEFLDPSNLFGQQTQNAKAIRDQLVGLLSLENRQKLKGQGTITDQEAKTLEKSATLLAGNRLSEELAFKELNRVREIFGRARENAVKLPKGVTWQDIEATAKANNLSQTDVLREIQRRTSGG